jgi:competence protein ComEA
MGPSPTAPLDLNTATLEQLDALPGIGPTTAQKILDYRQAHGPFHSVADLDAVPGIGQGRIEQLKGLVIP